MNRLTTIRNQEGDSLRLVCESVFANATWKARPGKSITTNLVDGRAESRWSKSTCDHHKLPTTTFRDIGLSDKEAGVNKCSAQMKFYDLAEAIGQDCLASWLGPAVDAACDLAISSICQPEEVASFLEYTDDETVRASILGLWDAILEQHQDWRSSYLTETTGVTVYCQGR